MLRRALAILTLSSALVPTLASAQANATAPVATATQAGCSTRWVEEIYPNVRRSVVRVHTVGGIGSGFIFGDERHVATAFHVVAIGRPLEIHLSNDEIRTGSVVAADPEHDLAVVELDAPAPFPPLPVATSREGPAIGAEVVVVGHPLSGARGPQAFRLDGLLNWSASRGIVSAKNAVLIQTDASVNPGNSGGPMVDCSGRVLGVVSWKLAGSEVENLSFAVRSEVLTELWSVPRVRYVGRWVGTGSFSLLAHVQASQAAYFGLALGFGGDVFDRIDTMLRAGYLWGLDPDEGPVIVDTRRRLLAQLEVRGRALIGRASGLYLAFGGGASFFHDLYTARRFEISTTTPPELQTRTIHYSNGYFRPNATLAVVFGRSVELGYWLVLDAGAFKDSVHQVALSVVSN